MIIVLKTNDNSTWKLDLKNKAYERILHEGDSVSVERGDLLMVGRLKVGKPGMIFTPTLKGSCEVGKIIKTAAIVNIETGENHAAVSAVRK